MGNCGSGEQTKPQQAQQQTKVVAATDNSPDNSPQKEQKQQQQPVATSSNEPTTATPSKPQQQEQQQQQQQHQQKALPSVDDSFTHHSKHASDANKPSATSEEERRRQDEEAEAERQLKAAADEEAKRLKKQQDEEAAAKKKAEEEEAEKKRIEEEEEKKRKDAEEEKYKKEMLEAAIQTYKNDVATAQSYRADGPSDLRDRSIHRACLNNPSLIQINDLFGKKDPIRFREMMFKMRIKKGLIGRSGFHPVLGVIVGNFFFYFPPSANDVTNSTAEAVQCLGSMYLKGVKVSEMANADGKRRILLESAVPRKKVEGKKASDQQSGENTLQLGFDDELQRSRFEQCVEEVAIPRPSKEVADALKARGQNLFIGSIGGEVQGDEDDD